MTKVSKRRLLNQIYLFFKFSEVKISMKLDKIQIFILKFDLENPRPR